MLNKCAGLWASGSRSLPLALLALLTTRCGDLRENVPRLSGQWRIHIESTASRSKDLRTANGRLDLHPAPLQGPDCKQDRLICSTHVQGTAEISTRNVLGGQLPPDVVGGVLKNGDVFLLVGGCCDRGELDLRGHLKAGVIRGRWAETRLGRGREGTFTMSRLR
jgi:hypothetical protein